MPHLSPMNWILSILFFWISLTLLASTIWWTKNHLFFSKLYHINMNMKEQWKWQLQDGRD